MIITPKTLFSQITRKLLANFVVLTHNRDIYPVDLTES
jgi:hypothetical protein